MICIARVVFWSYERIYSLIRWQQHVRKNLLELRTRLAAHVQLPSSADAWPTDQLATVVNNWSELDASTSTLRPTEWKNEELLLILEKTCPAKTRAMALLLHRFYWSTLVRDWREIAYRTCSAYKNSFYMQSTLYMRYSVLWPQVCRRKRLFPHPQHRGSFPADREV